MKTICTLRQMLARNVELHPDKTALIEGERQYTFRQFAERTNGIGNALLGLGLKKGERVAILSKNSIENCESYYSIPNAGLILVMLNFRLAAPEVLAILSDAGVSALMVNEEYLETIEGIESNLGFIRHFIFIGNAEKVPEGWLYYEALAGHSSGQPEVEISEDDIAALMYTSGTTGLPKGCMATHGNFYHMGRSATIEGKTDKTDVAIIACPLFHAAGVEILSNTMYAGAASVVLPQWDPDEFCRLVQKHKITCGMLATPMMLFLLTYQKVDDYDLSSLKKLFFAGAPVTPVIFQRAIERFGNIFMHLYGTTETVGKITTLLLEDVTEALARGRTEILSSCGRSSADVEAIVVDENDNPVPPGVIGEMKARGLGNVVGYWNKEEETKKSFRKGWYYPQDLCKVDERGFVYIVDRKKDMVITGGENVYPTEVESALYKHPAVHQASVIGIRDEKWGEAVTAFIVRKEDASVTEDDIRSFCRKEIAGYKVPKKVFFVESLPMSPSGKILKYKLRDQYR